MAFAISSCAGPATPRRRGSGPCGFPAGRRKLQPGQTGPCGTRRRGTHAIFWPSHLKLWPFQPISRRLSDRSRFCEVRPRFPARPPTDRVSRIPRPRRINDCCNTRRPRPARHEGVDPPAVRHRQRPRGAGLFRAGRARAGPRPGLPLRQADDARDPCRLRAQSPRHDCGLSRHRQIDARRAGRGAAELALRARQSRQPCQPHRPDRQGRDRHPRRRAGDRVPRRHPALGAAEQRRALLRRVRCRPAGRDVRDPARARVWPR